MTPSLSTLAMRNQRRATLARRAIPLSIALLLGLVLAAQAREQRDTAAGRAPVAAGFAIGR